MPHKSYTKPNCCIRVWKIPQLQHLILSQRLSAFRNRLSAVRQPVTPPAFKQLIKQEAEEKGRSQTVV